MNCNNCTNNNALKEVKIKHVHGNVLRMAIPLTLRTIELVDGEINATDTPFVPSSEHPVKVVFSKGSVSVALDATMKDGNIAYIEEKGKIPVGTYAITVTCNDDNGNPYRFKQNAVLYVADATIEAGIEETIEYEVMTWYLDAAIFLALKGEDGVGIYDIETQSSGEIGGVNTVTFILTDGRTRSFNILNGSGAVDSDLDINSPSPIANSAVTAKFNELSGELADLFGDVDYDTSSKSIRFWDKGKTNVLASLDARPFIKDGMVSNAYISNNTLVITFNTDSGKEAIGVPLTTVFNPNNYYTKTQVDSRIASAVANINLSNYYTKAQVDAMVDGKADTTEVLTKTQHLGADGKLKSEYATQLVLYYMGEPYDEGITTPVQPFQPIFDNGYISYAISGSTAHSLGQPQPHILYCNAKTNKLYRWNGSEFVQVGGSGSGSGGYEPPVGGIPKTDLASDVQASLGKADTALQSSDLDGYATTDDVDDAVAALVSSAPQTLDTLKELADALGDDPNFATTMVTQLGDKVDKETGKSLMTDAERTKLQGIAAGAEVNVQPNWTQTNTSADDYIKNKPDLSTFATKTEVNAKQDTINDLDAIRSGAALGATALQSFTETDPNVPDWAKQQTKPTYTAQEVGALPATTTIPTKTSDLTNDSGFTSNAGTITGITMNGVSKGTSGVVDLGTVITAHQDISGKANTSDLATVATSGSYNDLSNKPTIPTVPTNVSAFTNDAGYTTNTGTVTGISVNGGTAQQPTNGVVSLTIATGGDNDIVGISDGTASDGAVVFSKRNGDTVTLDFNHSHPQYALANSLSTVATSGDYDDLTGKPTKVSDFTNDSGFTSNTGTLTGVTFNGSAATVSNGVAAITATIPDVSGKANASEMAVSTSGDQTTITLKTGTSATVINQHQSLSGYAKYVLLADEAAYTALATKDSGTLYLIPEA